MNKKISNKTSLRSYSVPKSRLKVEKIFIVHQHFTNLPEPLLKKYRELEFYAKYIHINSPASVIVKVKS